jgi:acyl CoA:acetate/3-ketoacid CoA transferase beta subunit
MFGIVRVSVADRMCWAMAQEVRDGDVIVVGVATPMALCAALVGRELRTNVTVIAAASVQPSGVDVGAMTAHPALISAHAVGTLTQFEILDQIQRGRVTLQFVSPLQVDQHGRFNTSRIRTPDGGWRRFPGGLAHGDVAVLVGRLVAYRAEHSTRFLVQEVDFTTGAGRHQGPDWRTARELPGKGVQMIVTDRSVLRPTNGPKWRITFAAGPVDDLINTSAIPLVSDPELDTFSAPPSWAQALIDEADRAGMRGLEVRATRPDATAALKELRR